MLLLGADAWVCRAAFYLLAAVALNNALPLKNSMRPTPILSMPPKNIRGHCFPTPEVRKVDYALTIGGQLCQKKRPQSIGANPMKMGRGRNTKSYSSELANHWTIVGGSTVTLPQQEPPPPPVPPPIHPPPPPTRPPPPPPPPPRAGGGRMFDTSLPESNCSPRQVYSTQEMPLQTVTTSPTKIRSGRETFQTFPLVGLRRSISSERSLLVPSSGFGVLKVHPIGH